MPMPAIWRLQLKWTQKVSLAGVFLLGWFVVFTSIMRIVSLPASAKSKEPTCMPPPPAPDLTWCIPPANISKGGSVNATIWAEIEGGTGIICACLPALRAPAVQLYRHCIGKTGNDTSSRSRAYSEFHEIDKAHGGHFDADADANKFDKAHGIFTNPNPNRRSRVTDPWGDAIPLSTAQATATRGRSSDGDEDSEERVMGIIKTVHVDVSNNV